ncbi:ankyrin repeat domain-containing protein [Runella slithyformis]|uniref:Ankyrin repeat domain-containing protein n=1 Tax=Runella slithyformis (strain ATCC 29530 / DSM 19594 / LMG 11500 / NCIMB 11436 / LSU 4) TaxID=761193 RepID=A0A7U3ZNZ4_RUNSL|nr:ankyrin repeat domain-containing protein [Runella slithyformis]AEI50707.1 hypothetical protein Runsl_4378 [Runella slithyformis DSM 19594]
MDTNRQTKIELLAGDGKLDQLQQLLGQSYTQFEIDMALENAIAYSKLQTADFLLKLGAQFSNNEYQGVYYAVHNNELEGLKYSIQKGVDINVNNGMLINTSIITATNTKNISIVRWLIENGADTKYLTNDSIAIVEKFGTSALKELIKDF